MFRYLKSQDTSPSRRPSVFETEGTDKNVTYILRSCEWSNNSPLSQRFVKFCVFPFATLSSHDIDRLPVGKKIDVWGNIKPSTRIKNIYYYYTYSRLNYTNHKDNSSQTYPVLQASLIILTESAVTTNASAQARCPRCGFGPEICDSCYQGLTTYSPFYQISHI